MPYAEHGEFGIFAKMGGSLMEALPWQTSTDQFGWKGRIRSVYLEMGVYCGYNNC
jgi:hypothetical protein